MSFNAYITARNAAQTAIEGMSTTAIGQELGITLPPFRRVRRHTRGYTPTDTPIAVIGQARGEIDDTRSINTTCSLVVMAVISGSNPDTMDDQMAGYITALVRLFSGREVGGVFFRCTGFDADQPTPYEGTTNLVQTGAVLLEARIIEAA